MVSDSSPLNEFTIYEILDTLRLSSASTCSKTFNQIVEEVWEKLKLEPNPEHENHPNPIFLENLLIKVIEDIYTEQSAAQAVGKKDPKREAAINYDISLLMFGLLDGYYHTIISQGVKTPVESSIRYKQYLYADVYVKLEYAGEGTYAKIVEKEQIERPGKQPRPLNHITSIAKECKKQIGSKLFGMIESKGYQACSQTADFDEQTGQRIDLPKPRFTLEEYIPRTSTGKMVPMPTERTSDEKKEGENKLTDGDGTFEENNPANKPEEAEQPTKSPKPCGEIPPERPARGLKMWIKKLFSSKAFVATASVFLIVIITLIIASCRGLRQQQYQKELELFRELLQAPSGSEIEMTKSNSFGIGDAIYKTETTVTVRIPENPDGNTEFIAGEEFAGTFSEPLD